MNIQTNRWQLSRRHTLKGLGVMIGLPFLNCMVPKSYGAKMVENQHIKRSIFAYIPNGVNTLDYQITEEGKDYHFSKTLKSLEAHRNEVTPISGLYHPHGLGTAHNCEKIWLTGGKINANSISVDQLIARRTSEFTRHTSLELSNSGGRSLAWTNEGIQLPAARNPAQVFRQMFKAPKGGLDTQLRNIQKQGSILNTVMDEVKSLETKLGKEDKGRLDQYLTSVSELELRSTRAEQWIHTPLPVVDKNTQKSLNRNVSENEVGDYFRTMYDLIVLAFQTDMTRVATFSTGVEGKGLAIPEIGVLSGRHSLSHHGGNEDRLNDLSKSDAFNIAQFSYFIARLKETTEPQGSLLDTTVALYGSGMTYGHSHGCANLPLILAGGSKLGFKHGTHVDFNSKVKTFTKYTLDNPGSQYRICHNPVNKKALMSNLLLTIAQKSDIEVESFGDSTGTMDEVTR